MSKEREITDRAQERRRAIEAKLAARAESIAVAKAAAAARARERDEARAVADAEAKARANARAIAVAEERARLEAEIRARAEARAAEREAAAAQARIAAEERAEARRLAREAASGDRSETGIPGPGDLTGKQRLIDAAMRLHGEKRSFASLGIREIAREAHLNPNTFYRHFESIDDLAVAAVAQCGDRLRPMLHQIRTLASRVDAVSVAVLEVSAFYAFVLGNTDAFVVGVTEYHSGSARVREAIASLLGDVAREMRDDITDLHIFPHVQPQYLDIACRTIVEHLFHLSQEYIEKPERRAAIVEASECTIVWMFAGATFGAPANVAALVAPRT